MKLLLLILVALLVVWDPALSDARRSGGGYSRSGHGHVGSYSRTVRVRGYSKKSGAHVSPHNRTSPDSTRNNNWSHKGNINPYTGKVGSKR